MTLTYGFYDSLNGDRKYNASQMSKLFEGIITDGIFESVGSALIVTSNSNMTVSVGTGRAWFDLTWTNNDSVLVLTAQASEAALNRIDTVVIEINTDLAVRANSIKIIKGTPATTPVAPTLSNTATLKQYALANLYVAANVTQITTGNITNKIGTVSTPFITSPLTSLNIQVLFDQLIAQFTVNTETNQATFDTWFNNLVDQLTGVQVTNLQGQIDTINTQLATNGWKALGSTLSFSSVDSPTGVLSSNQNLTGKLTKGMRLKYDQAQALTAYFPMDANATSTVGAFTSTPVGAPTFTAGKFSNALTLNGTTQSVQITDTALMKPTGDFTIGMWFKTASNAFQCLFSSYSGSPNIAGLQIYTSASLPGVIVGKYTGGAASVDYTQLSGITNIADNAWHYLVVTMRNNYLQIYLDGNLEAASYSYAPVYAATSYVRIGARGTTGADNTFWNGQIDDIFLINGYALDEETVFNKYLLSTAQGTTNITVTKKAIVTGVGPWNGSAQLITAYHGTDHLLVNAAISNAYYSFEKTPYGFNPNPNKWTILHRSDVSFTKSSPVTSSLYYSEIGAHNIVAPIGVWELNTSIEAYGSNNTGTVAMVISVMLSTSNSAFVGDNSFLMRLFGAVVSSSFGGKVVIHKTLSLKAKTTYYLLARVDTPATGLVVSGAAVPTIMTLTSSYI